ncbi:putative bifunctional diguanylate cyclase/phosphodiesterase [Longispora albida]|uniref:putative bifunctional diguanylate cyclase/phosphodiesterase n=1 Tax=Longispora albida TaxID=203523 RepID=UPI000374527A|nr:EAL domain-containing protein [Longispora albida]
MWSRTASIVLASWLALLAIVYYAAEPARRTLWVVIGFSAAAAVVIAVRRYRPERPVLWWMLAAGMALFVAADLATPLLGRQWRSQGAESLFIDAFYIGVLICLGAALSGFAHYSAGWGRASLLDGLALLSAAGLISWTMLIVPRLASPLGEGLNTIEQIALAAYPLGDLFLLALVVRLVVGARWTVPVVLIGLGGLSFFTANAYYQGTATLGSWEPGHLVDLGWFGFLLAWGLAALHPGMVELTRPGLARSAELTQQRLLLLAVCGLVPPLLLITTDLFAEHHVRDRVTIPAALALIVILSLIMARLLGAFQLNRRALRRERSLREAGARFVAATSEAEATRAAEAAVASLLPRTPHEVTLGPGNGEPAAFATTVRSGVLLVAAADEPALTELKPSLDVLASQAAMALSRIGLTAEVNRRNSEAYFRTLVHNATDVILILDDHGRIRYGSPSAAVMFGTGFAPGADFLGQLSDGDQPELARWLREPADHASEPAAEHRTSWTVLGAGGTQIEVEASGRDLRSDPTVGGLVLTLHDVTERRQLERELTHRAFHDPLTGLANRALFAERVSEALAESRLTGSLSGVILIDLDDFKLVNDTLGHPAGDELLIQVAGRLREILRPSDMAARIGGDEFAILITGVQDSAVIESVASRVVLAMTVPAQIGDHLVGAGVSAGVASSALATGTEELIANADLALYAAKADGKGSWHLFRPELHSAVTERMNLRSELERAIAAGEFSVRYQPIVQLGAAEAPPAGLEALVRWEHPVRGTLRPGEFISVAEETGLIVPIGTQVMRRAIAAAAGWPRLRPGGKRPYVAINVSARQFRTPGLVRSIHAELDHAGLSPTCLMLEITESLLLHEDERVWTELAGLRAAGVRVAIDDFGTGYSSLSYLRQTAVDLVKIDRSFIAGLDRSAPQRALVDGIIRIAHTLGLAVVAEGIETTAERSILTALHCDYGQGYLFSPPMTQAETTEWLTR